MAPRNFIGETFVAYLDISGFKKLMYEDEQKALYALDYFYYFGYNITLQPRYEEYKVAGLFVSDCAILFVRRKENKPFEKKLAIELLLKKIKTINTNMISKGFIVNSGISFGKFIYMRKIEHENIGKEPIYGKAYLEAYKLDACQDFCV